MYPGGMSLSYAARFNRCLRLNSWLLVPPTAKQVIEAERGLPRWATHYGRFADGGACY